MSDNAVVSHRQHGFTLGKSYLTNLISFCDKVTHLVDQERPVDVVYFGFSKDSKVLIVSLTVSLFWMELRDTARQVHNTLGEKLVVKSGFKEL